MTIFTAAFSAVEVSAAARSALPTNKATVDIKAAFQEHGPALVKALLSLTESEDERVRLSAINACLDRGWGKPPQAVEAKVESDFTITWQQ